MPEILAFNVSELPKYGFKAVELGGRSVLVGRIENRVFAYLDRCPHAGVPLRIGKLKGEELTCGRHGWIFNLVTGHSVPDNPEFHLVEFSVRIEDSKIWVTLPDENNVL